jgi:hypothetical protein
MNLPPLSFVVEPTQQGFRASSVDYSIVVTGKTKNELMTNIVEATNLYLQVQGTERVVSSDNIRFLQNQLPENEHSH